MVEYLVEFAVEHVFVCSIIFAILLLFVFIASSYVKAPPSIAYVVSGTTKLPKIITGSAGFRWRFFERLDTVYLGQMTVPIKTDNSIPTNDFIKVNVDAVAKVRVIQTDEGIRLASKNFLNMGSETISEQLQDSLQGNMREIIGTLDLKSLNTDRDSFSAQIMMKAAPDMSKLGIEIISCNIQNVVDDNDLIKDLGADNTFKIKKDAAITKAVSERDIEIQVASAKKESNNAKVDSDTAIAIKNNELVLKKAELKIIEDTQNAKADAAYEIQKQEQQKEINIRTVEADIERIKKEQELSFEKIKIKENEYEAEVNKKANADKYKIEREAEARLEQNKREAESRKYNAIQDAEAQKAKAEAIKFQMLQEADGIRAKGEAEAAAIKARGEAEAEAMDKKAEAYAKYKEAAIIEMALKALPSTASSVAEALKSIKSINIYGSSGDSISTVSGVMPTVIKQAFDTIKSATGVNVADVIRANTIEAKTTHNISLNDNGVLKDIGGGSNG